MAGAKGPNGPVAKCFGTGNRLRSPESLDCRQKASRKVLLVERTPLLFLMPYSYSWAERGPLCTAHIGSTQNWEGVWRLSSPETVARRTCVIASCAAQQLLD